MSIVAAQIEMDVPIGRWTRSEHDLWHELGHPPPAMAMLTSRLMNEAKHAAGRCRLLGHTLVATSKRVLPAAFS